MDLPKDHPQRFEVHNEVHARPSEALETPGRISFVALLSHWSQREEEWNGICELARRFDAPPPWPGTVHFSANLGRFRLIWERHTEFSRYTFIAAGAVPDPFAEPAIALAPAAWVASRPGQVLAAGHAAVLPAEGGTINAEAIAERHFAGNMLFGSAVSGDAGDAFTDLRIHSDGFSRFLVQNRKMTPMQSGRTAQRLIEIETYRIMALLALPIARELTPIVTERERELAQITELMVKADETDEAALLGRLTRLAAEIDRRDAAHHYRFSAATAYYDIVRRRLKELREKRIEGLQTIGEFMERRLAPAMNTCQSIAERQESLSERVARATQLLSTRVDLTRESQNREVLESMNRRAKLQLRLQTTVEGLSVAAITYYTVALISYGAKSLAAAGVNLYPDLATGVSIPVVAVSVWAGLRGLRRRVVHEDESGRAKK